MSLIELVIAVAVIGVLLGLVLTGIQSVRRTAALTVSRNNLRELALATQIIADRENGRIQDLTRQNLPVKPLYSENTIFYHLVDVVHGRQPVNPTSPGTDFFENDMPSHVKAFLDSSDYSLVVPNVKGSAHGCCYACNMLVFDNFSPFPSTITDGTSSTIGYAQHLYFTPYNSVRLSYNYIFPYFPNPAQNDIVPCCNRRASFADAGWQDVVPVRDPATGRTVASKRGLTFQARPPLDQLNAFIPSSPYTAGLPVAMLDGSVRTLSPASTSRCSGRW